MKTNFKIITIILAGILASSCMVKTNETEIGIKIKKLAIFGKSGVQKDIYSPGQYHFYIPVLTEFKKFDTRLQTIDMTYDSKTGDSRLQDDLLFKTIDGNDISLDVIIQYRIIPDQAYNIVQYVATNDYELKNTIIRTISRSKPRDIFGELKTEEFYISKKRESKSEVVKEELNKIFQPMGIIVESVLTKDYRFNKAYQQAIEDKKIADQSAERNKSATSAAIEEYKKKMEEAQGEVNKTIAAVDGEFKKAQIEADAYYDKMAKMAQAVDAEGISEAKGIAKYNEALAGTGGKAMVKLEIAAALKGKKIFLLPMSQGGMNIKTTNINDLLNTYGIMSLSKDKQATPDK